MTVIKKVATVVVTAVLATGVLAGTSSSADAASKKPRPQTEQTQQITIVKSLADTGWG